MADCQCPACVKACTRYPGWMVPANASDAIEAGLAHSLMLDYYMPDKRFGNTVPIFVLCPAIEGYGGKIAPLALSGTCVFLKDEKCSIHDTGFKPQQCKTTFICSSKGEDKLDIVKHWVTPEALKLVRRWATLVTSAKEN